MFEIPRVQILIDAESTPPIFANDQIPQDATEEPQPTPKPSFDAQRFVLENSTFME